MLSRIEELLDILESAIQDFEAQMGLRMAARLTEVVHRLARHLNRIFSGIAATVALTPILVSDIYVLLILQCVLVSLIASLSVETFRWKPQESLSSEWEALQVPDMCLN